MFLGEEEGVGGSQITYNPCFVVKDIFIVAHSYGGVVTVDLARQMRSDFLERVSGVFMTDRKTTS